MKGASHDSENELLHSSPEASFGTSEHCKGIRTLCFFLIWLGRTLATQRNKYLFAAQTRSWMITVIVLFHMYNVGGLLMNNTYSLHLQNKANLEHLPSPLPVLSSKLLQKYSLLNIHLKAADLLQKCALVN